MVESRRDQGYVSSLAFTFRAHSKSAPYACILPWDGRGPLVEAIPSRGRQRSSGPTSCPTITLERLHESSSSNSLPHCLGRNGCTQTGTGLVQRWPRPAANAYCTQAKPRRHKEDGLYSSRLAWPLHKLPPRNSHSANWDWVGICNGTGFFGALQHPVLAALLPTWLPDNVACSSYSFKADTWTTQNSAPILS